MPFAPSSVLAHSSGCLLVHVPMILIPLVPEADLPDCLRSEGGGAKEDERSDLAVRSKCSGT